MVTIARGPERVYLVGVQLPGMTAVETAEQMEELADLSRSAGAEVVGSEVQRKSEIDPAFYLGKGKVDELKARRLELGYETIICNEDLSPRQQRNLEEVLDTKVVDRTELILDIFARNARTREGRLQVESAQLHHTLPRLIGAWDYHRQVGGIGARGGPGEQQIEVERRRLRRRLRSLDHELAEVKSQRDQQRGARRRSELPTVAIVGYTNAGKSTLLNSLTGARAIAANRLFATLDPTVRRLKLPSGRHVLLADTVGFIQKLPTDLVAAFRATLEEVTQADVVLEVLDLSSPSVVEQADTVAAVLTQLDAAETPRVVALNKVDAVGPATRRRLVAELSRRYPGAVQISALQKTGFEGLLAAIDRATRGDVVVLDLLVPYGQESVLAELRAVGGLEATEYAGEGTRARGWAPGHAAHRFARYRDGRSGGGAT